MNSRLLIILFTCIFSVSKAQLTITPLLDTTSTGGKRLVDTLLSGSGLSGPPTNIKFRGDTASVGFFRGNSNLGINNGIILTTGYVSDINRPPNSLNQSYGTNVTGDSLLELYSPTPITDVSMLEFDFVPKTDTIRFRYSFASEEYPEFVCCPYTDVFGFFISGPKPSGGNYVDDNVALIPGTSIPVGVGSINPGVAACTTPSYCQSLAYSAYYNTNTGTTVVYDAFTDVLEVIIPVLMCEDYHIKLAIGDAFDQAYDSGVFLEARSFGGGWVHIEDTASTSIGSDSSVVCRGDSITLIAPNSFSYLWTGGGTSQSIVVHYPPDTVVYNYVVFNPSNGCFNANISYTIIPSAPVSIIDTLGPVTLCAGDSVQLFATQTGQSYLWSNGATASSIWVDYSEVGTYTLTVMDQWGQCDSVSSAVTIYPGNGVANITVVGDTILCPGETVTLTANAGLIYTWSSGATTQSVTVGAAGNYTVTVDNGGCSASATKTVYLSTPNATITPNGATTFCDPGNVTLNAPFGYTSYLWTGGTSASGLLVNSTGTYTVTVTDSAGCLASSSQLVTVNTASASISALTDSVICTGGGDSIQIFASAGAGFLWSNGLTTQNIWVSSPISYSVQITNINGCTGTSAPVTIGSSFANATLTNDTTLCIGSNLNITAGGGGNYLWSTGSVASSLLVNPISTTSYTVTVTNIYGCTASNDVQVTVNDPQVAIATVDPTTFCLGDSAVFNATAGYANYNWTTGPNGNYPSVPVYGAALVSVIVTDADGCTATSTSVQTLTDSATVTVQLSNDPVLCPNEQINLTAQTSPLSVYAWSTGATTAIISVFPGTYTVTVTNVNGCSTESTPVTLTLSQPTAQISTNTGNLLFCPDSTLILNETGGTGVSWSWSTNEVSQSIVISDSGTYYVTVTNADNCTALAALTVGLDNPSASITITSGTAAFCDGNQATLSANGGTGPFTYLWSDGSTTQDIIVIAQNNYTVTVYDNIGCPATDDQSIIVNSATATISPSVDSTFCTGDSIQLFNTSPNTVSVVWLPNGLTSPSIWVANANGYSFVVTDINGCTATSSTVNTTLNYPSAIITPQSSVIICPDSTVTLNANNGLNYTFLWSNGSTAPSVVADTTDIYTVTVTNELGCVAVSNQLQVTMSIPTATITSPDPDYILCPGEQAHLNANPGIAWLWLPGQQTSPSLATYLEGTYRVQVTNADGCVAVSDPVFVDTLSAFAKIKVTGNTSFCRGETVTIESETQGLNYLWFDYFNLAFTSADPSITVDESGKYAVTVTNFNGCTATSVATEVSVHEYPVISFTADSTSECDAFKIRFRNYSIFDNNSIIAWTFGDSTTSNQYSPIHWYTINGTYNVTLTITTPSGCSSTDSSEIEVIRYPDPVADFAIENNIENVFAGPIAFINKSKNSNRYHWDFGDNTGSLETNPVHDYREAGYYIITLTAFNPANCEHQEEKEVTIAPIFIPSAFTPNGDGKNDIFPSGLPANLEVNAYQISIFNRWGERVFFSDNPSYGWNGTGRNGALAPDAAYVYEMKITDLLNKDFTFKGSITVVR